MTPPSPSYMSKDQFAQYLADLRTNRTARPGGARPQPTQSSRGSLERRSDDTASQPAANPQHGRTPSEAPSTAAVSVSSRRSTATSRGRDYYPTTPTVPLKPSDVVGTSTYMERGQRWMEKEEAVSLRSAMEDMDLRKPGAATSDDDESRIYNAALDEAAELVWQHENGGSLPQPDGPYRYKPHLRKNSYAHARTASIGKHGDGVAPSGLSRDIVSRSLSVSSTESSGSSKAPLQPGDPSLPAGSAGRSSKAYGGIGTGRRRTSLKRDISGEVERPFSGDQIWEEPEASSSTKSAAFGRISPDKLNHKPRSPMNRARLDRFQHGSNFAKSLNQVEIHRNPPTQTRNPQYTTNGPSAKTGPDPSVERKNGIEVRGQDIRAATSRRLKDRSSRLPEPTAVSDSPGRPITGKPKSTGPEDELGGSGPTVDVPIIVTDEAADKSSAAPSRPLPSPGARRAQRPRGHWSPAPGAIGRATAACHECGLAIEGRFVALAGNPERFHPHCFSCFVCGTSLEAMEISPEPDHVRTERIERIHRRAAGEAVEESAGRTAAEDGDDRLRFFCHLDWHELFAPRCKHCRTPILGEHIVALGEHWHYGHFFCAECGDPFEHGMTHIEKDGYAWCIGCQTKRTERRAPKCKKCKVAVIGQYIQALGGEWHEHCFRCAECHGGFDDGQIFPKEVEGGGLVVLCTDCRARELKL
ncbi:hypothetical protein CDD83_1127 [Cordyceps sp. RAO-2017]|nr:hypothetical protein CDD83_1127 [Cordyceps sp. RAO-2017]